jgi:pyruvate ferredoxin oxidoreductase alpha subunit
MPGAKKSLTGNYAAAYGAKLARVAITFIFPIGPSDEVAENMAQYYAKGELKGRVIDLQFERSTVNAQWTATLAGVRCLFATNSEGLLVAEQQLVASAAARLPLVIAVANRAISPPVVVSPDLQDTVMQRDAGWISFYCENAQDVLDTMIQAYRIAEDNEVRLPAFVCYDGWEVSHSVYPCVIPDQELVDEFLPPLSFGEGIDILNVDYASLYSEKKDRPWKNYYMPMRYKMVHAMDAAREKIVIVGKEYHQKFGSPYYGLLESVNVDGADIVVITMGGITSTAKYALSLWEDEKVKVGLIKLRTLRPFPGPELGRLLRKAKVVLVVERDISAAIYHELRDALYDLDQRPKVVGRVAGIGGNDVTYFDFLKMIHEAKKVLNGKVSVSPLDWHFESIQDLAKTKMED